MTTAPASTGPAAQSGWGRLLRVLPAVTLLAVLTITASAEYELARTVLNLPPSIAWALPVAIDSYVLAALRSRRDVAPALAVMAGALTASMGAHLALTARTGAGQPADLPPTLTAPLATAIMTVLVVVAWRVHVLLDHPGAAPDSAPGDAPGPADAPAVTVSVSPAPSTPDAPGALPAPGVPAALPAASAAAPVEPAAAPVEPGSARTRAAALPSAPTNGAAPPSAPSSSASRPSRGARSEPLTDAEILAHVGSGTPSIRALRREHGIGQARATRLHKIILTTRIALDRSSGNTQVYEQAAAPDTNAQNHSQYQTKEDDMTRETATEPRADAGEAGEVGTEDYHGTRYEESSQESKSERARDTHTCITDRVGQSRSTTNGVDHGLDGESAAPRDDFTGVLLELAANNARPGRRG